MTHETGILNAVQKHVGDAEHVRQLLLLDGAQCLLHALLILNLFHIALAHVADGAGKESARAAGGVEENFAGPGIDAVHHERSDGAGRVILAGIAGALQVVEDLLIDVAEMLPLGEIIEVHLVDFVDDLPHELAGLHVVVGVLEHIAHNAAAVALLSGDGEFLELGKSWVLMNVSSSSPVMPSGSAAQRAPTEVCRDGRAVALLHQLQLLVLVVDDFEEEHPAELRDALGIAIDAGVLAHDVLNGFDGVANGHSLSFLLVKRGLEFMHGEHEIRARPELLDELKGRSHRIKRRDLQNARVPKIDDALVLVFLQQRFEHGAGLRTIFGENIALADIVCALAARERPAGRMRHGR